jgi:energy-coupling factor transport system permease protein
MAKAHSFVSRNTPIEGVNPIVKIYAVFSFGLGALIFPGCKLGFGIVVFLFLVAMLAKILKPFAKIMFGFGIPITVMLMFIQGCYSPRNVTSIADLGFAKLGLEGVEYALKIVSSLLVFLGAFYIMNVTTYTGKLVSALTGSGMNPKIGYLVLSSLNVVPQMQRKMSVIQEAQTARGVEMGGKLLSRMKAFVPLLGPVVLSSLTDAQERGMTLETRGFGITGVKPTSFIEVKYSRSDKIIKLLLIAFFVATVALTVLIKVGVLGGQRG